MILCGLLVSLSIGAEQLRFNKTSTSAQVSLDYRWHDQQEQPRTLTFSLDKQAMDAAARTQVEFKPQVAQRYVYVALMKEAQKINPKEARVNIIQRGERLELSVTSRSAQARQKWLATITEKQTSAFEQYLTDNHYTKYTDHMGLTGVLPDHIRYIQESRALVLPVAQAMYNQLDPGSDTRDYVNRLLSWVQSIPYDKLESRIDNNGAGYFSPVEVLINNKGDCDSKAVLTASLMRTLLPNLSMAIVYLPNHALLAVNLGQRPEEQSIDIQGARHVLLEPTGPALLSIGEVSDDTARHIANGSYTVVTIP